MQKQNHIPIPLTSRGAKQSKVKQSETASQRKKIAKLPDDVPFVSGN